jgi:hypothetical protein
MSNTEKTKSVQDERVKPIVPESFDIKRLIETNFEDIPRNKAQRVAFVRYTDPVFGENSFICQTPWFEYNVHGIPMLGEFYPTDDDRDFMKVPLDDKNNKKMKPFIGMLSQIDKKYSSDKWKEKQFKKEGVKNHMYKSIVRMPQPRQEKVTGKDDNKKQSESKFKKIDSSTVKFCKAKFNFEYPTSFNSTKDPKKGDKQPEKKKKKAESDDEDESEGTKKSKKTVATDRTVSTLIFHRTLDKKTKEKKRIPVPVKTMTDVAKAIPFGSTVRLIMMCNKMWEMKTRDGYGNHQYGPSFKILLAEVKLSGKGNKNNITIDNILSDSDDDEGLEESSDPKKNKDSDDDNDENDSDEETTKKSKKQAKKVSKKDSDDDDDDDDNDDSPKKTVSKKSKKKDSDDDDEDDSESKKSKKKDSDDDESDDDDKPKKKPVGKGK